MKNIKKKLDFAVLGRIFDYMAKYKIHIFLVSIFILISSGVTAVSSLFLQVLIDKTSVDMIFVDLPEGFRQMNLWVLALCTAVLQVYTDDAAGRERLERVRADVYFKNLEIPGAIMTVLNKCRQRTSEEDIAGKFPMSESLAQGKQIADVQEKNPAFLKSCMDLLEKMA